MIEVNLTNWITIGLMALTFFAAYEWGKSKLMAGKAVTTGGG